LLAILDNVWNAEYTMPFVDVYILWLQNNMYWCITQKMGINAKIPPMQFFDIDSMEINEAACAAINLPNH